MLQRPINVRPERFSINPNSKLGQTLVLANFGCLHGSLRYKNSAISLPINGVLNGFVMDNPPSTAWIFDNYLNRWVLSFNGTTSYVDCTTSSKLKPTGTASWSWWMNMPDSTIDRAPLGDGGNTGARGFQVITTANSQQIRFSVASSASALYSTTTFTTVFRNAWHHFLMVFKPNVGLYVYQDGVLTGWNTSSPPPSLYQNNYRLAIGNRGDLNYPCNGKICDVMIANSDLSPWVTQLANPRNVMYTDLLIPEKNHTYPKFILKYPVESYLSLPIDIRMGVPLDSNGNFILDNRTVEWILANRNIEWEIANQQTNWTLDKPNLVWNIEKRTR